MSLLLSTGAQARALTYVPHIILFPLLFLMPAEVRGLRDIAFFFWTRGVLVDLIDVDMKLNMRVQDEDIFFVCIEVTRQRCSCTCFQSLRTMPALCTTSHFTCTNYVRGSKEEEIQLIPRGMAQNPLCGDEIQQMYFLEIYNLNGKIKFRFLWCTSVPYVST
jgi:hypothetical protein